MSPRTPVAADAYEAMVAPALHGVDGAGRPPEPPSSTQRVQLLPGHRRDLQRSGLSDATITAARIMSIPPALLEVYLGDVAHRTGVTAYLIPYSHPDDFWRARLIPALRTGDGHSLKYMQAPGSPVRLYFGTMAWAQRAQTSPLWLVEGEKKALKMEQEGFPCVAIGGLWNWLQQHRPIADLKAINFAGRPVGFIPDSDIWMDPEKKRPVFALAMELRGRGALVDVIQLPSLDAEGKTGVDDYLVRRELQRAGSRRIMLGAPSAPALPALDDTSDEGLPRHGIHQTQLPIWLQEREWYRTWKKNIDRSQQQKETAPSPSTPQELAELQLRCGSILNAVDPLDEIGKEIKRLGWGGDIRPLKVLYLSATSRLLPKESGALLAHVQINGPAGTGKSFALGRVLALMPPQSFRKYDAASPRVLIFDPSPFKHRVVVYSEADSLPGATNGGEENPAASLFRTLLQDGEATYTVSIRDKETGLYTTTDILKEGPTVLITTTVNRLTGNQMDSRLLAVDVPDNPEQQKRALKARAHAHLEGTIPEPNPACLAFQSYLQALAPIRVVVPFVGAFYGLLGQSRIDSRLLRDAALLLSLIESVAILRLAKRGLDAQGRIIATLEDYATVADLIEEMYENTATEVSRGVRALVEAVKRMPTCTVTQVAKNLQINRTTAWRRARIALDRGWLVNAELRERHPWRLKGSDEPLPHPCGLPSVAGIQARLRRTPVPARDVPADA